MARLLEHIVDEEEFMKHHEQQVQKRSQRDVFFIWMLIIFISVLAAHFILNITGSTPTGFVTAAENPTANVTILLGAMLLVFVVILIGGLVYTGITKKDH
jgi:F0F1-type ATP synthase membrane subunit a